MELVQLRCFLAVARELHIGRAARRLDMLPASLGRHLKNLENTFGTSLVTRTTRHVALSETWRALLVEARPMTPSSERAR